MSAEMNFEVIILDLNSTTNISLTFYKYLLFLVCQAKYARAVWFNNHEAGKFVHSQRNMKTAKFTGIACVRQIYLHKFVAINVNERVHGLKTANGWINCRFIMIWSLLLYHKIGSLHENYQHDYMYPRRNLMRPIWGIGEEKLFLSLPLYGTKCKIFAHFSHHLSLKLNVQNNLKMQSIVIFALISLSSNFSHGRLSARWMRLPN